VCDALERGELSVRAANRISRLEGPREQTLELTRILVASLHALDTISAKFSPKQQDRWLTKELKRRAEKREGEHLTGAAAKNRLICDQKLQE
jgi:hypothetical protein